MSRPGAKSRSTAPKRTANGENPYGFRLDIVIDVMLGAPEQDPTHRTKSSPGHGLTDLGIEREKLQRCSKLFDEQPWCQGPMVAPPSVDPREVGLGERRESDWGHDRRRITSIA